MPYYPEPENYLGRQQSGDVVTLMLVTVDGSGVPTAPDSPPSAIVYGDSGVVATSLLPMVDRYIFTGLFALPIVLDSSYAAGRYRAVMSYAISSTTYTKTVEFEVLSSGGSAGMPCAMAMMAMPDVDYAVVGSLRGLVQRFRNPRSL